MPTGQAATISPPERLLPIALDTLTSSRSCSFDLFMRAGNRQPMLYRRADVPLEQADLLRLAESGVKTLLIRFNDREAYSEHLRKEVLSNDSLSLGQRYQLLKAATRRIFESAYESENIGAIVASSQQFGSDLSEALCRQEPLMRDLFGLMFHDYYTFTHATNVSTYCVALAIRLSIKDKGDLSAIASGGLLHDLGKRDISGAILNKPGTLNEAERELIKRHPQIGFEILCLQPDLTWGQLMMVYQHHERLDGRGYPVGVLGREMHPWSKICAVADVFDALTCDRTHRKALPIADALDFLQRRAGTSFDKEIVECLASMMCND